MTEFTSERLAELRAVAEAATEGPWGENGSLFQVAETGSGIGQVWGQEFRDTIAKVRAEAQVEVLRQQAEEFYCDGEGDWDGYGVSHALTIYADRIAREAGIETGESND